MNNRFRQRVQVSDRPRQSHGSDGVAESSEDIVDWALLSSLPGIGPATFGNLLDHFRSPGRVLAAGPEVWGRLDWLRDNQRKSLLEAPRFRSRISQMMERLQELGGAAISLADPRYPTLLRQLSDPPPILYCLGKTALLGGVMVAIVGSRAATSYGKKIAERLARGLASHGVTVVSGLAHGIDAFGHRGALEAEGSTVAVLGCGVDICYPRENGKIYRAIAEKGLLVSEYPPGTRVEGFRFPARNRIIAGMSQAIVVVEAARRSGSLITAQIGLDYGREVCSVPGQVDSCKSEGCHHLLRQGAKLVRSADDILSELPQGVFSTEGKGGGFQEWSAGSEESPLEPELAGVLEKLGPYPKDRDQLFQEAGIDGARGAELLLLLELDGYIEVLPGNRVARTG